MTGSLIFQEIRDICNGNINTPLLDTTTLVRRLNMAYEEIVAYIMVVDGKWQFDDTNYTDFPIGTTNLVNAQQDYTFASDVLEVEQVAVLDSSNNFQLLQELDIHQMGIDPTEFYENDGLPVYYDKLGRSLRLYPTPATADVTLTNGLKVSFKRTADLFTVAQINTATKEPGFAVPFHKILAWMSAIPWLATYDPKQVRFYEEKVAAVKKEIMKHYSRREQDRKKVLRPSNIAFR